MKLNVKAFAFACAVVWGLGLFVVTWWIIILHGAADLDSDTYTPPFIGLVYYGYSFTVVGSFIGLAWALIDGLILGLIFAWVYNLFVDKITAQPEKEASQAGETAP